MRKLTVVIAAAAVALAAIAPVAVDAGTAQERRWVRQLEDQLDAILAEIGPDFDASSDILVGELETGETAGLEVELIAGVEYLVVGVCDTDCHDLDLAIFDADGDLVDADTQSDDVPVIQFEAYEDTVVWVEVSMPGCNAATCAFGMQAYAR